MSEIPASSGFAEFVSQLIADTFSAVIESQVRQEMELSQLQSAITLDDEIFAEEHVDDAAVEARLAELFPPEDPAKRPHGIYKDAPYDPGRKGPETPPIRTLLGIEIGRAEVRVSRAGGMFLNARGVAKVRRAVRMQIAQAQLDALRQMTARGVPRVVVDSGHVRAKVTFEITDEADPAPAPPVLMGPGVAAMTRPRLLQGRIMVRQADERAPQTTDLKIDVFGEVEVTFKTIT